MPGIKSKIVRISENPLISKVLGMWTVHDPFLIFHTYLNLLLLAKLPLAASRPQTGSIFYPFLIFTNYLKR